MDSAGGWVERMGGFSGGAGFFLLAPSSANEPRTPLNTWLCAGRGEKNGSIAIASPRPACNQKPARSSGFAITWYFRRCNGFWAGVGFNPLNSRVRSQNSRHAQGYNCDGVHVLHHGGETYEP